MLFSAMYMPPYYGQIKLTYFVLGPIQIYTNFSSNQKGFLRADRADDKERIYFDERKFGLGLRSPVAKFLSIEFSTQYAFLREIRESTSMLSRKDATISKLGNSWFYSLDLRFKF